MSKRLTVKEKNEILSAENKSLNYYGLVLKLYPTGEQAVLIDKTVGCARLVYNLYLSKRQEYYKETGKTLSISKYKKSFLVPMKSTDEYHFLKEVDKFALESSLDFVEDAYTRFFKGQNGFPRFKSKRKAKKAYTTKLTNNNIEIKDGFVKLPKLGLVKFNKTKSLGSNFHKTKYKQARIIKATVSERAGEYYVSLLCQEVVPIVESIKLPDIEPGRVIGIDLGLKDFATITNGNKHKKVPNPKYLEKSTKRLAKEQRRLSKKQKGSKNFVKAKKKIAKLHQRVQNQRIDFAHQLSRKLVNENQVIIVEDLNIRGMVKNKHLAKAISDVGWSRFITYLNYKLEKDGKHLVKVDRWFASSKLCSSCKEKNIMLTLSEREWVCSSCGTKLDRDINASINIRNEGLNSLGVTA